MSDEGYIREALGRIEQKVDGLTGEFRSHVALDMEAYKAIGALKTEQARQQGKTTVLAVVAGAVVTGLGYVAEKLWFGSH